MTERSSMLSQHSLRVIRHSIAGTLFAGWIVTWLFLATELGIASILFLGIALAPPALYAFVVMSKWGVALIGISLLLHGAFSWWSIISYRGDRFMQGFDLVYGAILGGAILFTGLIADAIVRAVSRHKIPGGG